MCVCLSVQECLCVHICISAGVQGESVNCPLDFVVGREAGALPLSQLRATWNQPGPTEEGLRPGLLPERDHPSPGSSFRPWGDGQGGTFMAN